MTGPRGRGRDDGTSDEPVAPDDPTTTGDGDRTLDVDPTDDRELTDDPTTDPYHGVHDAPDGT